MGKYVIRSPQLTLNSVDLSNHIKSINVKRGKDAVEVTASGDGTHINLPGLRVGGFSGELYQDFAGGSVDATFAAIDALDTAVPIIVKPSSGAEGATNPAYTTTVVVTKSDPINGQVGTASMIPFEAELAGAVVRDVTP